MGYVAWCLRVLKVFWTSWILWCSLNPIISTLGLSPGLHTCISGSLSQAFHFYTLSHHRISDTTPPNRFWLRVASTKSAQIPNNFPFNLLAYSNSFEPQGSRLSIIDLRTLLTISKQVHSGSREIPILMVSCRPGFQRPKMDEPSPRDCMLRWEWLHKGCEWRIVADATHVLLNPSKPLFRPVPRLQSIEFIILSSSDSNSNSHRATTRIVNKNRESFQIMIHQQMQTK